MRKYLLRLPKGFSRNQCSNAVFDFHGATSTAEAQFQYSGYPELADSTQTILVYPDANKTYVDQTHELAEYWDSAWEANLRERDYDIDFVLELVATLQNEFCIERLYASGMSAGGDVTSALACLTESPFDAFATVTYRYYNAPECAEAPPRPMISFQGDNDFVVPIEGSGPPWNDPSMQAIMRAWSKHNRCIGGVFEEVLTDEVVRHYWQGCAASTEWYLVVGGGHTWPGREGPFLLGHSTMDISASALIWDFFGLEETAVVR